jgi:hypothetical protein
LQDIQMEAKTLCVRVGKNRFRVRTIALNRTAWWAVERLLDRGHKLGAINPDHYLIPRRITGKRYDPAKPPSRWGWRTAWRKLTEEAGLGGLRPHDLRHHAITKLAESPEASEQTIRPSPGTSPKKCWNTAATSGRRRSGKRSSRWIKSQLAKWEAAAKKREETKKRKNNGKQMVGTGRFELPTPRTPSECSTRLSHVPTRKEPAASHPQRMGLTRGFYHQGAVRGAARFCFRSKVIGPTNLYPRGRMLASGSIRAHIETPMES